MPKPLSEIRLFLLDMDGTVYLGDRLFPSTKPFLQKLAEKKIEYLYLTNNSSRDKTEYLKKLDALGIGAEEKRLLTSGDAMTGILQTGYAGKSVYLVGTPALARAFQQSGIRLADSKSADLAVLGFDTGLTYEKLNGLYQMVKSGKPYLATHPDLVCPVEGGAVPDAGAVIAYIYTITGRNPDVIAGKPERYLIDAASKRFGVPIPEIAMVGDRLGTDIAAAARTGAVSVLVLTGEATREDLKTSGILPDYIFPDLSGITGQLSR